MLISLELIRKSNDTGLDTAYLGHHRQHLLRFLFVGHRHSPVSSCVVCYPLISAYTISGCARPHSHLSFLRNQLFYFQIIRHSCRPSGDNYRAAVLDSSNPPLKARCKLIRLINRARWAEIYLPKSAPLASAFGIKQTLSYRRQISLLAIGSCNG